MKQTVVICCLLFLNFCKSTCVSWKHFWKECLGINRVSTTVNCNYTILQLQMPMRVYVNKMQPKKSSVCCVHDVSR